MDSSEPLEPMKHALEAAVYDPSHRMEGSGYWQWASVRTDDGQWNEVANQVHKGWPTRGIESLDPGAAWYGILDEGSVPFWCYRVYPAGRDGFGRTGRYFFILFRITSVDQLVSRELAGMVSYFEGHRELPLQTQPIRRGITGHDAPIELTRLRDWWLREHAPGHWGVDGCGNSTFFGPVNLSVPVAPSVKQERETGIFGPFRWIRERRMPWKSAGIALLAIGVWTVAVHSIGYTRGKAAGYSNGLAEGREAGRKDGLAAAAQEAKKGMFFESSDSEPEWGLPNDQPLEPDHLESKQAQPAGDRN